MTPSYVTWLSIKHSLYLKFQVIWPHHTRLCVTWILHMWYNSNHNLQPQSQDQSHLSRGHEKKKVHRKEEGWGEAESGRGGREATHKKLFDILGFVFLHPWKKRAGLPNVKPPSLIACSEILKSESATIIPCACCCLWITHVSCG